MEETKFEVIIVGAGPAGIAAAYTLAKAGVETAVFERGRYPGAKNLFGGLLFTTVLNKLIPEFVEQAPLERHILRRKFAFLNADSELGVEVGSERFNQPPYNNTFTVLRAKFDQWFAGKAEETGAMILPETTVDELIIQDGKVVGVTARGDRMLANVVICADGVNSLLAKQAGLRDDFRPEEMALGVKEIISLPSEVIADRFALEENEGVAMEFIGAAVKGLVGGGFLYTNKESLSVGVIVSLHDLTRAGIPPNDILDAFKEHPSVRKLLRGGQSEEYAAHLIPEGGFKSVPEVVTDGLLLVGDAAHLVNASVFHEGTNLAMASGVMAAETVIEARQKGDFSKASLQAYKKKLTHSFVLKDLEKFRHFAQFKDTTPRFFNEYTNLLVELASDYFTVSEASKAEIQRSVFRKFRSRVGWWHLARDLNKFRKGML